MTATLPPPPDFSGTGNQKLNNPSGIVTPGQMLNYIVQFRNNGGRAYGVTIEDRLDPNLDWSAGFAANPPPDGTPDATGLTTWSFGYVPNGSGTNILFSVPVRASVCHGAVIANSASVLVAGTPVASLGPVMNTVERGTRLAFSPESVGSTNSHVCGAAAGETAHVLGRFTLENPVLPGAGTVAWSGLRLEMTTATGMAVPAADSFTRFSIRDASGTVLGQVATIAGSLLPVTVAYSPPIVLIPGASRDVTLEGDISPAPSFARSGWVCVGSGADVLQADQASGCPVSLTAKSPYSFPMCMAPLEFFDSRWAGSLQVHPNPIDPAAGPAVIQFFLEEASRVTVTVYTQRGERVRTIASDAVRPAGLSCVDVWDGTNGSGQSVRTGAYLVVVRAKGVATGTDRRQTIPVAVAR